MLPPGHITGGYLAALAAAKLFGQDIPELNSASFIAFGAFMGFAPDLDTFYKFHEAGRMYDQEKGMDDSHRRYHSHAPLFYLAIAALLFMAGISARSTALQAFAVMFLVGSWSHFFLDTFESSGHGIRWLFPFTDRVFSFFPMLFKKAVGGNNFFEYWITFVKHYARRPEFYLEIAIIIIGLWVFLK